MSWVLAFAGFAALIVLHEAGHFAAAKAVGMRVERFFLFFPPKLLSIKRGETEYGIGMIPLGGFVKITGMNPDEELPEEIAQDTGLQVEKVKNTLKVAKRTVSLENHIGEGDTELGALIEDKKSVSPLEAVINRDLRDKIHKMLNTLSPKEERILRMRFGLGEETPHTLEEVGQMFGVSRERIRQIEAQALRKLKHPSRSNHLRSFLEN